MYRPVDAEPVVVVGAGITGLTAAWELARAGVPVTVLDAANRAGGMISTERRGEWIIERGPTSMLATPDVASLVEQLGLGGDVTPVAAAARHRYVARGRRLLAVPMSPAALATTSLLSGRAKWRLLLEPFVRHQGPLDETLASFVRRRLGPEVLANLVSPFVSGVYAGDAERLSVRHAMPSLCELERRHGSLLVGAVRSARARRRERGPARARSISVRGGLDRLTETLTAGLGDHVRLGARVDCVTPRGSGWTIDTQGPSGCLERLVASHVVMTTPAASLRVLDVGRALEESREAIVSTPHAPVATMSIGVRRKDVAHALDGFGFLVADGERRAVLGALFTSTMFSGRCPADHALVTCFLGGAKAPWRAALSAEQALPAVMKDLHDLLGVRGDPSFVAHRYHESAIPQYDDSHTAALAAADVLEASFAGLTLAGSWRTGVSVGDCIAGARRAAQRARAHAGRSR